MSHRKITLFHCMLLFFIGSYLATTTIVNAKNQTQRGSSQRNTTSANKAPLVITIHGTAQTIYQQSDCDPLKNNPDDSCECCLMTEYTINHPEQTGDDIVKTCIAAKKCSEQSVTSLKKTKKIGTGSAQNLLTALYDDVIIRPMVFDTSLLQSNGQFTEQSLPQFLAQAYRENKLNNPAFSKAECLKAKNLGTGGGYNTLQLFSITSTCSSGPASIYILKEAREGIAEATNLKEVENLTAMKDIIAPKVKTGLPSVALPLAYFAYPDKQKVHYIAAMPSAKGKPLVDLIINFAKSQTPQNKALLERAFKILGLETANFHKLFSKPVSGKVIGLTMAHGDFHFFNLFFDEIAGHFTFIDNEPMEKSIKNRVSPAVDIDKLFFMPFSINDTFQQFRDAIEGIDLKTWFDIAVKNFSIGYASAYPQNKQKQAYEELKKIFNDPFTIPWVDFDDQQLQEIRKNYINPIFDQLISAK